MAIEFRCVQCGKLLRTGDETAGKQAKCPECGAVMLVPAVAGGAGGAPLPPSPPPGGGSPFGAAGPRASRPADPGQSQWVMRHSTLDFGDVFGRTWAIFKEQWGMCLAVVVLVVVLNFGCGFVLGFAVGVARAVTRNYQLYVILSLMARMVTLLFGIWLGIGQAKFFLKTARGQRAEIIEVFSGGPQYVSILLASLLFGVIVALGTLALIVPGVILALMFSQFYYLILDRDLPVLESFRRSQRLMAGNKMTLFVIRLAAAGITIVACIPCCLGLFVAIPFFALLNAVVYLAITGQPTADQLRAGPTA
jgi:uncharacterized membrane protein/DNA-directed RNA polymerase subunit RPC12/RpoP